MSSKYSFKLQSQDRRRQLPGKIIIGQQATETITHVVLKLFAFLLFYRERIQIETHLHMDSIPYVPDLVQLDYELRPVLWVECGECNLTKLDRLAVKVPEAEIWVLKPSYDAAEDLVRGMAKADLRRDRYNIIGFDLAMIEEVCGLVQGRNDLLWVQGEFEPPTIQFDLNGLWFDAAFLRLRF